MAYYGFILSALSILVLRPVGAKEVTIGFGISKPPYVIAETKSGLEYEIIDAALKAAGHSLNPSFAPQTRGELYLKAKEIDGAATKRQDSFDGFFPSDVYIHYHNFAFSLKSKPLTIKKISDLGKYSVRAFQTAKTLLGNEFKAMADSNPKYFEVANQKFQVAQLFGNRVEVVIADDRVFEHFLGIVKAEQGFTDEIIKYDIFPMSPYVVMFHDKNLRDSFNKGLAKIKANKTYEEILAKYNSPIRPK